MGAEGANKNSNNSDAETILPSLRDLIKGSSAQLVPDHHQDPKYDDDDDDQDQDENIAINIPRISLQPIKIKVECLASGGRDDRIVDVDEDRDGPKTPTGEQHRIPVNVACPPAPKKQRRPLKRRRTLFQTEGNSSVQHVQRPMRLVELSHEEIESLFPRRSNNIRDINDDHHNHHHRPGNIKKVNKANFTSLMSFR